MKIFLFIFFFSFGIAFSSESEAEQEYQKLNSDIDSLGTVSSDFWDDFDLPAPDTTRVKKIIFLHQKFLQKYPNSHRTCRAAQTAAHFALRIGDFELAKYFTKISLINAKYHKADIDALELPAEHLIYGGYLLLADTYLKEGNFQTALEQRRLAESPQIMPRIITCGLGSKEQAKRRAIFYSKCYLGLGEVDSALKILLETVIQYGLEQKYLTVLKENLLKKFSKEEILSELNNFPWNIVQNEKSVTMRIFGINLAIDYGYRVEPTVIKQIPENPIFKNLAQELNKQN